MTKELYIKIMHIKDRCILFYDENKIHGVITYVLTDKPEKLSDDVWRIPKDNPNGKYIYFDRLISYHKDNKDSPLFKNIKQTIRYFKNRFPDKQIVWNSRRANGRQFNFKNS